MRAVVVGGGTGGLAAAIALQNAGLDVCVLEKSRALDDVQIGGGHVLWHNAVIVLRRIGVGDAIEAVAPTVERYEFRTTAGRVLATWRVGERGRELGAPAVTIGRPALHRVLAEAAGDVVRVGARVVGFRQDGSSVAAILDDGSEERGDILIGADGLRSAVRAQLLGDEPPRYADYTAWQGVTAFADRSLPEGVFTNTGGRGTRFFSFRIDKGDAVYWDGVTGAREGGKQVTGGTRRQTLIDRFGEWHDPIGRLIEQTDEQAISAIDIYDRKPTSRWGEGRVTLLGDAAHPSTFNLGQGACQAPRGRGGARPRARQRPRRWGRRHRSRRGAALLRVKPHEADGGHDEHRSPHRQIEQVSHPLLCRLRDAFVSVAHERLVVKQTYALMTRHDL